MSEWPYNLPIWRRDHRAASPDGRFIAEIYPAYEVSMGNPTFGTLWLSAGLSLKLCNPSFIWSDDSRYLAVPQFYYRFGLFCGQRLVVIDTLERVVMASAETAWYFLPESFSGGRLVATKNPFQRRPRQIEWQIPKDLARFRPLAVEWTEPVQQSKADSC